MSLVARAATLRLSSRHSELGENDRSVGHWRITTSIKGVSPGTHGRIFIAHDTCVLRPRVCDTFPASRSSTRPRKAAPAVIMAENPDVRGDSEAPIGQRGNITHVHTPKMGGYIPNREGCEMLPGTTGFCRERGDRPAIELRDGKGHLLSISRPRRPELRINCNDIVYRVIFWQLHERKGDGVAYFALNGGWR